MFTSRQWYRIAYHLLFESLFLADPSRLPALCFVLDRHAWLGWYVKRLHLIRFYAPQRLTITHIEHMLVSVIHQCPNLELFTVEWAITPSFSAIADSLTTFSSKTLRSIHWTIAPTSLARLIWALDSLPALVSLSIDFEAPNASDETAEEQAEEASLLLGSASQISLMFSCLEQLSLRGASQDFLEQAAGWSLPVLQGFSLDFVASRHDLPDILEFLKQHGSQLYFLDLNTIPALDLSSILEACPLLTSFSFNPDWRLPFHIESNDPAASPTLIRAPHPHITHLGLHQLLHAFLPSKPRELAPTLTPVATYLIQRTNDLTFTQLTHQFFPALKVIRVLNRTLLKGLEKNNGPEDEGFERWEKWYEQCKAQGIRLEDCTGALLGDLPMDEDEDEIEEEGLDDVPEKEVEGARKPTNVNELRELLQEIRRMSMVVEPVFDLPQEALRP